MVDTGSSVSLARRSKFINDYDLRPCSVRLQAMNGSVVCANEVACLPAIEIDALNLGPLSVYVVPSLPLDVDIVLGLDVISEHGITVDKVGVTFGKAFSVNALTPEECRIEDKDFEAWFASGVWTVRWNWREDGPRRAYSSPTRNFVQACDFQAVDAEIQAWVASGILIEHNPSVHGEIRRFLPVLAVRQRKGDALKVRPVFDYRDMNESLESHPGGATPVCADRLRAWRQVVGGGAVIDLKAAYLQVRVVPDLWTHQAIKWKGRVFLLTRLGFGVASAPKIMTKIVETVVASDKEIKGAVTSYIDDLFIATDVVSCERVKQHLTNWGLEAKKPQVLGLDEGVRVLGLRIGKDMKWSRDGEFSDVPVEPLTRREVHGMLGRWLGHYPVAGWLRVASGFVQRMTAQLKIAWDDKVDNFVMKCLADIATRLRDEGDTVRGSWQVQPNSPMSVWADASKIAVGVALEVDGDVVEDAAWLRPPDDLSHINRAELDAIVKGISMALKWGKRKLTVKTDSSTCYGWLKAIVDCTHNLKVKGLDEVLIRRRLQILSEICETEDLELSVELVPSELNKADALTRVPVKWLSSLKSVSCAGVLNDTAAVSQAEIKQVHELNHFGVARTLRFAREKFGQAVSRRVVKKVVSECERCQRIDPSPNFQWDRGAISAGDVWEKLAVDITHSGGAPHLSVIDLFSKFAVWRRLRDESACEVVAHLEQIFCEFGPPAEIMSDNGTVFRSRQCQEMLQQWEVRHQLSCAYRPQGNSVVERNHRTIKRAAKRGAMSAEKAVFWWNASSDGKPSPFESLFSARPRIPGVRSCRVEVQRPRKQFEELRHTDYSDVERNPFVVGQRVFLRPSSGLCDKEWSGPHTVTQIMSSVSLILDEDGIPRHISHLRRVPGVQVGDSESELEINGHGAGSDSDSSETSQRRDAIPLRRSARQRHTPRWLQDFVVEA